MKKWLPLFIISTIILSFVGCIYPGHSNKEVDTGEQFYDGRLVRTIGDYGRPSTYRAKSEKMNRSEEESSVEDRYRRDRSGYGGGESSYVEDREEEYNRYERDRSHYEGNSTYISGDSREEQEEDCRKTKRKKAKKERSEKNRSSKSEYGSYDEYKAAQRARKSDNSSSRKERDRSGGAYYYEEESRSNDYYVDRSLSDDYYADSGRGDSYGSYGYQPSRYSADNGDSRRDRGAERFEYDDKMESLDKKMDKTRTEGERKLQRRATMLADRYCSCDRKRKESNVIKCQDTILDEVYRISDGIRDQFFRAAFNGMFKKAVLDC